jgi:hypothetical protein
MLASAESPQLVCRSFLHHLTIGLNVLSISLYRPTLTLASLAGGSSARRHHLWWSRRLDWMHWERLSCFPAFALSQRRRRHPLPPHSLVLHSYHSLIWCSICCQACLLEGISSFSLTITRRCLNHNFDDDAIIQEIISPAWTPVKFSKFSGNFCPYLTLWYIWLFNQFLGVCSHIFLWWLSWRFACSHCSSMKEFEMSKW